ncbi:hypothetical protein POK33_38200 [Burkholderia cenocepacia]|uniref:hypothetical protein n=1 Tax=Burkholderia cenocepacia TaxID=95486 RepID=UPI0023B97407|nr:hypothetical protein [Burkholderia cenocepacia]MDF0506588.1 hypothetical protein [Burkholderia cenocepacia]
MADDKSTRQQQALLKAKLEREARIAEFANGADARPKSDPVVLGDTIENGASDGPAPDLATTPHVEPGEPASGPVLPAHEDFPGSDEVTGAAAPAQEHAPQVSRAPRRAAKPVEAPPWADAHPRVKVPFTMQLTEERHLQLTWLKEHMPNTSIQKIINEAVDEKVAKLLREYYR